jgi:hypothetical protein
MSRVFRRPMFRKGGGVNMNGIMSGIEDRQNFSVGTDKPEQTLADLPTVEELTERNIETLQKAGGERTGYDPLTTFLLQYGPALASASPRGGLISTALGAAKDPVATMLQDRQREDQYQRQLRTQAAGAAIKKVDDMRSAFEARKFQADEAEKDRFFKKDMTAIDFENRMKLIQNEQDFLKLTEADRRAYEDKVRKDVQAFEKMTLEEQNAFKKELSESDQAFRLKLLEREIESKEKIEADKLKIYEGETDKARVERYLDDYEQDEVLATNRANYEKNKLRTKATDKFGTQYGGLIGDMHGDLAKAAKRKDNIGKVFYDITDNKFKQITRKDGKPGIVVIDDIDSYEIDTSSNIQDQKKKIREINYFSPDQKKKIKEIQENAPPPFDPYIN